MADGSLYGVVGEFETPKALVEAVWAARREGYSKLDALSPFPIHGIDEALGHGRSRLGFIVAVMGMSGAAAALLLQWWTGAVDYPLVVGGKPFFAFEFSIPITFELTVLLASFGAVFGMLALNGLPRLYHPVFHYSRIRGATDDKFLLVIEEKDRTADAMRLMKDLGAAHVETI